MKKDLEFLRIESLEDKIDNILSSSEPQSGSIKSVISEMEASGLTRNAYYFYLIGILYFHISNRTDEDTEHAVNAFEKSLKQDKSITLAPYYLGFLYYYKEHYNKALRVFEAADLEYLKDNDLLWRFYKVKEMIWCCHLLLTGSRFSGDRILSEAVAYFDHLATNENEENYNYPLNLIKAAYSAHLNYKISPEVLAKVIKLMKELDLHDEYRKEYYMFIKAIS